jgi:DNA-directed RNA polymerase specialized sigma subunit
MTKISEQYKGENVKSKKAIAKLEKMLAKSETVSQDAAASLKLNRELLKACIDMTKTKLWRYRKFIADHDDEQKAAEFVLTQLDLPEMDRKNARASLIKTYKTQIKKTLYSHKSYICPRV